MPNMMSGMETYMFLWLALAMLLCLLLIGTCIWLVTTWLKKQRTPITQNTSQPRDVYKGYEQGYQQPQQPLETYQEGGQHYPYPQNEQPQAQYPKMEQLQH